ncbi:crossover junction endodeoxyribonuclease RuvC [Mechercharimyces sp. CAU 1602]|uniref:crossover junction endodeoxyribonuclease RuvC n=1 Tax=Mechercharimyces sp. CAU 1602 TaxID=2973933 RepID=UPI002161F9DE|nr:crossover junction endodeoxyribonuclease RuvC [Mechercharimyces sp. CAU 1602]MCS1351412.1 crossover junction endodeoxyribonuclease RuvC [Mechercharimyces sp. CAU 1602]
MRVCGIDPGFAIVGFGIVDQEGSQLKPIQYGSIETEAGLPVPTRLKQIYDACQTLFSNYQPDVVAIEKLFFNRNVTTAFTVAEARGVMMLAAEEAGVEIREYTPLQVKMAVVGYGQAEKRQVQEMVKMLLSLPKVPKPDDVADALAIAICEAHSATPIQIKGEEGGRRGR